ncbi:MAG TPA: glycosyltransferase family 2 protein [Bryobacteraceae bacterium]|nr:glycosyltransferase family 2 protein [Bryobacteraceae bacterium]
MSVTAIIPNWNRRDMLLDVLSDLRKQSTPLADTLVIDNGSTDGSAEAAGLAGARVIRQSGNRGFAHAVNRGIEESSTDWVAILNNDVRVGEDWLARLLAGAAVPDCSFAASRLLSAREPQMLDGAFDLLCRGASPWRAGHMRLDGPEWRRPRRVSFVPFTAVIVRRSLFEQVGLLDEEFESYLEDVEFGLRCAMQGYEGIYVPEAVAYHWGSATLGKWNGETVRRHARNQLLLVRKHYPPDWLSRYGWRVLVAQLLWGCVAARHGAAWAWLKGTAEAVKRLRAAPPTHSHPRLHAILAASENDIRELQQRTGYDLYWRLYFSLT